MFGCEPLNHQWIMVDPWLPPFAHGLTMSNARHWTLEVHPKWLEVFWGAVASSHGRSSLWQTTMQLLQLLPVRCLVLHVKHRCVSEGPVYGDTMPLCYNMLCTSHCPVCSLFVPMFLFFWKVATALSPNISSRGIGFSVFYSDVSFSQALSPRFVWQIVPLACVAKIKI